MEEIIFTHKEFYELYRQWNEIINMFDGKPEDVIKDMFMVLEELVPVILSDIQQEYWDMYYHKQMSLSEIAEAQHLSSGAAVSKVLKGARENLWKVMTALFPNVPEHPWRDYLLPWGRHTAPAEYQSRRAKHIYNEDDCEY